MKLGLATPGVAPSTSAAAIPSGAVDDGPLQAPTRNAARGCTLAGMLVLATVFLTVYPIQNRSLVVQFEQIALILYTSFRAAWCVQAPRPRLVALVAWLWVYSLFGLIQTVQLSRNDNPFHVPAPDSVMSLQLAVMFAGLFAFDLATHVAYRRPNPPEARWRHLSLTRVLLLGWFTVLVAPALVARLGGVAALFSSRTDLAVALGGGTLYAPPASIVTIMYNFSNVAPFFSLFALIRLWQAGQFSFLRRPDLIVLAALLLACNILFNNPISQPRFWLATVLIGIGFSGGWVRRGFVQVLVVATYLLMSVVAFPYLDANRVSDTSTYGGVHTATGSVTQQYTEKTDYGTMQDVSNAITYVQENGFTSGRQISGALLFFVPRVLWPDKPFDTARLLAIHVGFFQNLNLDSPLWAEGYVDGGFVGVMIILGVFGFVIGIADRRYVGGGRPTTLASIFVPALAGYQLILLRGSLLQATSRLALMIVIGFFLSQKLAAIPRQRAGSGR